MEQLKSSDLIAIITAFFTLLSVAVYIYTAVILKRTADIAKKAIEEQRKSIATNINLTKLKFNTQFAIDMHYKFIEYKELLRFHSIEETDIEYCKLSIAQFVYIVNSLIAVEFYYSSETEYEKSWQPDDILKDFSEYRKTFLRNNCVRMAWKHIIRDRFTMAREFKEAIELFYKTEHF